MFLPLALAIKFTSPGSGFELGPLSFRFYGLLIALAVILGVFLSQKLAKYRQVDPGLLGDLVVWLVLGAIPAARLYYVLFQWDYYQTHPDQILKIWEGGLAIHGAILGGALAALIFCRLQRVSFWQMADLVAPSLILGQAIGRWGNFFNSEAYGAPTDLPWKLYIPPEHRYSLPPELRQFEYFHPTFLYESLWDLLVFFLLMGLFFKYPQAKRGTLFLVYAIGYSAGRFWIEGLRTDSLMLGPVRVAQLVSLVSIGFGLLGLLWLYGCNRRLPDLAGPKSSS